MAEIPELKRLPAPVSVVGGVRNCFEAVGSAYKGTHQPENICFAGLCPNV